MRRKGEKVGGGCELRRAGARPSSRAGYVLSVFGSLREPRFGYVILIGDYVMAKIFQGAVSSDVQ